MDDKDFLFSLYPNDLMRVYSPREMSLARVNKKSALPEKVLIPQGEGVFLYYKGIDVSSVLVKGITHDNTYENRTIGKTMLRIEKYEVDVLGNVRKIDREKRMDFSHKKKK